MEPVVSNSASNTCPDPINSNCVTVSQPIPGVVGCFPMSLSSALTSLGTTIAQTAGCCSGDFPPGNTSAYTGNWINFSSIPTSGSGSGYTFTIGGLGSAGSNVPQYKWTQQGDIELRGNFVLTVIPSFNSIQFNVSINTFNPLNFPTNFNALQRIFVVSQFGTTTSSTVIGSLIEIGVTLIYPGGGLDLNVRLFDNDFSPVGVLVELGGIKFNMS